MYCPPLVRPRRLVRDHDAPRTRAASERLELLLVCSSGGHALQLVSLLDAWEGFDRAWVSFDKDDVRSLLADERLYVAHGPTNRNVPNLLRNLRLAWRLIGTLRPRVILTTGAGVAVPFAWIGRLRGSRVIYVESFTRIETVSLSCRLIRPAAHRTYVQWPEMLGRLPGARFVGNVFFDR